MPTYSYRCTECGTAFDIHQEFTDASLTECPTCGGVLRKVYGSIGISFNGPGFYRTDSRAENKSKSGSKEGTSASPAGKSETGSDSKDSSSGSAKTADASSSSSESKASTKDSASKKSTATKSASKKPAA